MVESVYVSLIKGKFFKFLEISFRVIIEAQLCCSIPNSNYLHTPFLAREYFFFADLN